MQHEIIVSSTVLSNESKRLVMTRKKTMMFDEYTRKIKQLESIVDECQSIITSDDVDQNVFLDTLRRQRNAKIDIMTIREKRNRLMTNKRRRRG